MKTIEEQMSFYAAYHQDARNKATHFVGVPAIIVSLFIPLAWIGFEAGGVTVTAAMIFAGAVVLYYFFLDVPLAIAMLVVTALFVWLGQEIASLGAGPGCIGFGVLFVGGWILQLVATCSRAASPRWRTTCSRSSSRRSSSPPRCSSPWATSPRYTRPCNSGRFS